MYALGIDLGTTFTAAGTWRDGHAEIASIGSRSAAIPSVVLLREDETFVTGEAADRRGLTEPHRVAREFKRRLGDTTPLLLGGVPYSAEALMARLLRSVVDEVATRENEQPSAICVSHPANWGPYKIDLLRQAVRIAGLEVPVSYTTEPEAAAVFYAQQQRIEPGAVIAVYDLGGGTFDAAVLRKTPGGFQILGQPEGIERLGGIDFDAAVFGHVSRALGGRLAELDEDDRTAIAAVARLREECVRAKEALSADTDTSIPVLLPNLSTEIRLTRAELEAMVRPALHDTIEALKRALRSAGVTPEQLHSVLLVGGSSRMPIVAQMAGAELGRPVAVDAHPKHAVALGAAWLASGQSSAARVSSAPTPAVPPVPAIPVVSASPTTAAAAEPPVAGRAVASATVAAPLPRTPEPGPPTYGTRAEPPRGTEYGTPARSGQPTTFVSAAAGEEPPPPPVARPRRRLPLLIAIAVGVFVLLGGGAVALALSNGHGNPAGAGGSPSNGPSSHSPSPSPAAAAVPADEQCTPQIMNNPRWVCLTKATFDGKKITIEYTYGNNGTPFNVDGGFHVHIYGTDATGTNPPDSIEGTQGTGGHWYVEDQAPSIRLATSQDYKTAIGSKSVKVCGRIADSHHALVPDNSGNGTYKTGNCVPITVTTS